MAIADFARPFGNRLLSRNSRRRLLKVGTILIAALVSAVAIQNSPAAGTAKAKAAASHYGSADATFTTACHALVQGKYTDFVHCFTDDGLKEFAGYVHIAAVASVAAGSGEQGTPAQRELAKKIGAVLDRYASRRSSRPTDDASDADSLIAANRAAGMSIKDRPAFVAAVFKVYGQSSPTAADFKKNLSSINLLDVTVARPTAEASASAGFFGPAPMIVKFRSLAGQWKIDAVLDPPPKPLLAPLPAGQSQNLAAEPVEEPAAAGGGGGGGMGMGSMGGGKMAANIHYTKLPYRGEPSEVVHVSGQIASAEFAEQGGTIERTIVWVYAAPYHQRVKTPISIQNGGFEFNLLPGFYEFRFEASGGRDAWLARKSLYFDLSNGPPLLELEPIDLEPTKLTRLYGQPVPEIPSDAKWIGCQPTTLAKLHGRVVLIHFCAHASSVCLSPSAPIVKLANQYGPLGLAVFTIHELGREESEFPYRAMPLVVKPLPVMVDVKGTDSFKHRLGGGAGLILIDHQGNLIRQYTLAASDPDLVPDLEAAMAAARAAK